MTGFAAMRPWLWWTIAVFSFLVSAYALVLYGILIPLGVPSFAVPLVTPAYTIALYAHILGGIVALSTGPFQFSVRLRKRNVRLHRILGVTYLAAIALGGIGGLVAALLSPSPFLARLGFGTLAVVWLVTGWFAWRAALARRFPTHRAWVYRSFALTLGAVTLRLEMPLLIAAFGGDMDAGYQAVAWTSWVPNLLLAEWLVRSKRGLLDATPGESGSTA